MRAPQVAALQPRRRSPAPVGRGRQRRGLDDAQQDWPAGCTDIARALLHAQAAAPVAAPTGVHEAALQRLSAAGDTTLALYAAVPFCATRCLCCERDVQLAQPADVIALHAQTLVSELLLLADVLGPQREVTRLHLGGGTANELGPAPLARFVEAVAHTWRLPADAELTAECDPRRIGWLHLQTLAALGFAGLSYGVLELDPAVQAAIGRTHAPALVADACDRARACGIRTLTLQLMLGLPGQTTAGWRSTMQQVLALAPERISLHRYHRRPQGAPQQRVLEMQQPAAPTPAALAEVALETLCGAGYRWLPGDNFVLDDDPLAAAADAGRLHVDLAGCAVAAPWSRLSLGPGGLSDVGGEVLMHETDPAAWRAAVLRHEVPVVRRLPAEGAGLLRRTALAQWLCGHPLRRPVADSPLAAAWQRLSTQAPAGAVRRQDDRVSLADGGRATWPDLAAAFNAPAMQEV